MKKIVFRHPASNDLCIEEVEDSGKLIGSITVLHDTSSDGAITAALQSEFDTQEAAKETAKQTRLAKRATAKSHLKEKFKDIDSMDTAQIKTLLKRIIQHVGADD